MNNKLFQAIQGRNLESPPVWIMRQAGRYLPEYKKMRGRYSFYEMTHQSELAVEVTLMPFRYFSLDAAIIFSDILVLLEALHIKVEMLEGVGPKVSPCLHQVSDLHLLPASPGLDTLEPVYQAIREVKKHLKVPLLGFCGAPLTLASYLIEGGSSVDLKKTRQWMTQHPESFHGLLNKLSDLAVVHLKAQIEAGVDAVQIFDSWACYLSDEEFSLFCAPYHKKMVAAISNCPVILFAKDSYRFVDSLVQAAPAVISCDWTLKLSDAFHKIPKNIAVQGNLNPTILLQDKQTVKKSVEELLKEITEPARYIFNLGHGILPTTPIENVQQLFESLRC